MYLYIIDENICIYILDLRIKFSYYSIVIDI